MVLSEAEIYCSFIIYVVSFLKKVTLFCGTLCILDIYRDRGRCDVIFTSLYTTWSSEEDFKLSSAESLILCLGQ